MNSTLLPEVHPLGAPLLDVGAIASPIAALLASFATRLAQGHEARLVTTALIATGYARDPIALDDLTRRFEPEVSAYLRQVDLPAIARDVASGLGPRDLAELAAQALPGPLTVAVAFAAGFALARFSR